MFTDTYFLPSIRQTHGVYGKSVHRLGAYHFGYETNWCWDNSAQWQYDIIYEQCCTEKLRIL